MSPSSRDQQGLTLSLEAACPVLERVARANALYTGYSSRPGHTIAFDVCGKPGLQHAACSFLRTRMWQAAGNKATRAKFVSVSRLAVPCPQPLLQACNDVCLLAEAGLQQVPRSCSRGCVPNCCNFALFTMLAGPATKLIKTIPACSVQSA